MATVGLVVNPQAGRDSRRLVGSAVVSDTYAKRKAGVAVLEGISAIDSRIRVLTMPDEHGLASGIVDDAPDGITVDLLDIPVTGTSADARAAGSELANRADVIVAFGGDGTVRDLATGIEQTPLAAISTGTNNVVPTPIDGTVAGVGAALLATGDVDTELVTRRHRSVRGRVVEPDRVRTIRGIASLAVIDQPFVGTRAILHGADVVGGVVSRGSPGETGVTGIAGALGSISPWEDGGFGFETAAPDDSPTTVTAVTLPGVVERIGMADSGRLDVDEPREFEVSEGVVSVDGERELEVTDGTVRLWPTSDGPRLVDFDALFEQVAAVGALRD
ncbi:MAG: diacylglycerol kinase family protein [archaeon]